MTYDTMAGEWLKRNKPRAWVGAVRIPGVFPDGSSIEVREDGVTLSAKAPERVTDDVPSALLSAKNRLFAGMGGLIPYMNTRANAAVSLVAIAATLAVGALAPSDARAGERYGFGYDAAALLSADASSKSETEESMERGDLKGSIEVSQSISEVTSN